MQNIALLLHFMLLIFPSTRFAYRSRVPQRGAPRGELSAMSLAPRAPPAACRTSRPAHSPDRLYR